MGSATLTAPVLVAPDLRGDERCAHPRGRRPTHPVRPHRAGGPPRRRAAAIGLSRKPSRSNGNTSQSATSPTGNRPWSSAAAAILAWYSCADSGIPGTLAGEVPLDRHPGNTSPTHFVLAGRRTGRPRPGVSPRPPARVGPGGRAGDAGCEERGRGPAPRGVPALWPSSAAGQLFFWISAHWRSTSSRPPHMKNACSATWSYSPSAILVNASIVSAAGRSSPRCR